MGSWNRELGEPSLESCLIRRSDFVAILVSYLRSSESFRTGQSTLGQANQGEEVNQERRRVSGPKEVNQEILESLGWSYLSDSAWLLGSAFC